MSRFFEAFAQMIEQVFGGNTRNPEPRIVVAPVRTHFPTRRHDHAIMRRNGPRPTEPIELPPAPRIFAKDANGEIWPRLPGEYKVTVRPDNHIH